MTIPVSAPVFTTLQDDRDDILSEHQNTPNDEITALATMLGMFGVAQSKSTDIIDSLVDTIRPTCKIQYNDATTITISAGRVWCKKSDGSERVHRKNTSTVDLTGSDLDSGGPSFANSTTYYVHASADAVATTFVGVISTSAASPSGLTIFRMIGGFSTDGSGNIIQESIFSVAGMRVVNVSYQETGDYLNCTATIPEDNTEPLISEGTEIMAKESYIPQKTTNLIRVDVVANGYCANIPVIIALFKDTTAEAIAAVSNTTYSSPANNIMFTHWMTAGQITSMRLSVRGGPSSAGNFYFNGMSASQKFNGVCASSITITEYEV